MSAARVRIAQERARVERRRARRSSTGVPRSHLTFEPSRKIKQGHGGGWTLACDLAKVTMRDIYTAFGSPSLLAIGNRTENTEQDLTPTNICGRTIVTAWADPTTEEPLRK